MTPALREERRCAIGVARNVGYSRRRFLGDRVVVGAERQLQGAQRLTGAQRLRRCAPPLAGSLEERAGGRRVAALAAEVRRLEQSLFAHELQHVGVQGSVFVFLVVVRNRGSRGCAACPEGAIDVRRDRERLDGRLPARERRGISLRRHLGQDA